MLLLEWLRKQCNHPAQGQTLPRKQDWPPLAPAGRISAWWCLAVGETVFLLHPSLPFSRRLKRDGEGVVSKMTVSPTVGGARSRMQGSGW